MLLIKIKINLYLGNKFQNIFQKNLFDYCLDITLDLTYLLHFNKLPDKKDIKLIKDFLNSVSFIFTEFNLPKLYSEIFKLKYLYNRITYNIKETIQSKRKCIINFWNEKGLSIDYMYIEFIHNILEMTINWFYLIYYYILGLNNKEIPFFYKNKNMDLNKYLFETIRFICPVKFISSNKTQKPKNLYIIHNLFNISRNKNLFKNPNNFNLNNFSNYEKNMSKCPFSNLNTTNNKLLKINH